MSSKAAPIPKFRRRHQSAFYRIAMHVQDTKSIPSRIGATRQDFVSGRCGVKDATKHGSKMLHPTILTGDTIAIAFPGEMPT
jgi:hypothetical protein